jgi:hypothetical protein
MSRVAPDLLVKWNEGDVVIVTRRLDLFPHGTVEAGTTGVVVLEGPDGYVEILLDGHHPGLNEWGNRLWLIPPDTDEIELSLRKGEVWERSHFVRSQRLVS